jgi:hypothetical protein
MRLQTTDISIYWISDIFNRFVRICNALVPIGATGPKTDDPINRGVMVLAGEYKNVRSMPTLGLPQKHDSIFRSLPLG